jgi:hypothetical protein
MDPVIYLRNRFKIRQGSEIAFLRGKQTFIKSVLDPKFISKNGSWRLVAAFAEWPLACDFSKSGEITDAHALQPSGTITQIWRLDQWDTLYKTMFQFSDSPWYRALGDSLSSEDQDLLVGANPGEYEGQFHWAHGVAPYCYVYEEARPNPGHAHAITRELSWFSAHVAAFEWEPVWLTSQVSSQPTTVCALWRVPGHVERVMENLDRITQQEVADPRHKRGSQRIFELASNFARRVYQPFQTEQLFERIYNGLPGFQIQ